MSDGPILDCFVGTGSAGIAALNAGREFVGIDRAESYINQARQRLDSNHIRSLFPND